MRSLDADCYFPASREDTQLDCDLFCFQQTGLADSGISLLEKVKRRKVCESELPESVNATAKYRAQIEIIPACEESQTEDDSETDPAEASSLSDIADPVNDRLCALQHLLPRGSELQKDEILKVAIDYVKALEREIQAFDYSMQDWSTCAESEAHNLALEGSKIAVTALQSDIGEESGVSEGNALQKRGLCIVPLSALAKAF